MSPEELARFRAGERDLFRRLVDTHSPRLLGVCRGFADDLDEAHDLVQETWVRVYAKRRTYRGGSFPAWLFAVCRRVCLSAARQHARRGVPERALERVADPMSTGAAERAAVRHDVRAAVTRALFGLPDRQRAVVVYRMIEGLSTRETAARMGCAEGTVKATLHQALARLAEPLAAHAMSPRPRAGAAS